MRHLPTPTRIWPTSHYVLLSLFFFTGLELVVTFHQWVYFFLAVLALLMTLGVVLVRLEERDRFRLNQIVLPLLAMTGLAGFAFFLPNDWLLQIYILFATALFFWLIKNGSKQAYPTWNWTISTVIYFLNTAVIIGMRFYQLPLMALLLLLFTVTFLISVQAFRRVVPLVSEAILIGLSVSLVLTEIGWVLQFLPLHYMIQAGLIVSGYYVLFHTVSVSYERRLSVQDLLEYGAIGGLAVLIILSTTRWV